MTRSRKNKPTPNVLPDDAAIAAEALPIDEPDAPDDDAHVFNEAALEAPAIDEAWADPVLAEPGADAAAAPALDEASAPLPDDPLDADLSLADVPGPSEEELAQQAAAQAATAQAEADESARIYRAEMHRIGASAEAHLAALRSLPGMPTLPPTPVAIQGLQIAHSALAGHYDRYPHSTPAEGVAAVKQLPEILHVAAHLLGFYRDLVVLSAHGALNEQALKAALEQVVSFDPALKPIAAIPTALL